MSSYIQKPNETNKAYRLRLYRNKDIYGLNNKEIGELCNRAFGVNWDESAHRKKVQNYIKGYDDAKKDMLNVSEQAQQTLQEIEDKKAELQKEIVRFRDERSALSRKICEIYRHGNTIDTIKEIVKEYTPSLFVETPKDTDRQSGYSNNDLIVHLTDLHTDAKFDNSFNKFDLDILKARLRKYLQKIQDIKELHQSSNCYLILGGDLISGLIHFEIRVESAENAIQQVIDASTLISSFTYELSKIFDNVFVYSVAGNHGRVHPDKKLTLKGENFDKLIPFYMEAALQNVKNVHIQNSNTNCDETMVRFTVRGLKVGTVHGDTDTPQNVVNGFAHMYREFPDLIYIGHYHSNGYQTFSGVKVIMSGSLQGMDNYCVEKRIYGYPEQTVSVISNSGFECLYDITLN